MHVISAVMGLALGLVVAAATHLAARMAWLDRLSSFFASTLGPIGWRPAFQLALLSSIGEEIFFRGAMQPALGLWLTTLIFGALHLPPRLSLASWTLLATILGLAFGLLMEQTGSISGPILAHFTINFLNLRLVGRKGEALQAPPQRTGTIKVSKRS